MIKDLLDFSDYSTKEIVTGVSIGLGVVSIMWLITIVIGGLQ